MLWKYQIIPSILWSYSLLDFIDGTQLNLEMYLLDKSGTTLKGRNLLYQKKEGKRSSTSNSNQCYSFTLSIVSGSGTMVLKSGLFDEPGKGEVQGFWDRSEVQLRSNHDVSFNF